MPTNLGVRLNPAYGFTPTPVPSAPEFQAGANFDPGAEIQRADGMTYNPTTAFRPEFQAAGNRAAYLNQQKTIRPLTQAEQFELANPIPEHMQGSKFMGRDLQISRGNEQDPTLRGSAYVLNDPANFTNVGKPLSVKSFPGGPPGWQRTPYDPNVPQSLKTQPWDVQFQRGMDQGVINPGSPLARSQNSGLMAGGPSMQGGQRRPGPKG